MCLCGSSSSLDQISDLLLCNITPMPISLETRVVPTRPIRRSELINSLNSLDGSNISGSSLVTVLSDYECEVVLSGTSLPSNFTAIGGVLIKTALSRKFCDGRNLLCDLNFWQLWDVIVFSGWCCLDVTRLNSVIGCGSIEYVALVRSEQVLLSPLWTAYTSSYRADWRCVEGAGYGVFSDIYNVFSLLTSKCVWFDNTAFPWPSRSLLVKYQQRFFEYQVELLGRMIECRRPTHNILKQVLDINAFAVSCTSGLPEGVNLNCIGDLQRLMLDELMSIVHFNHEEVDLSHLLSFCDVDYL